MRDTSQSLALWSAILKDMFRLWYLAELDLLSEGQPYELRNTGQVRAKEMTYIIHHDMSRHIF